MPTNAMGIFFKSRLRSVSEFALGAATAMLMVFCIIFLLVASAQLGISSNVFRYVGF
jgi:hypothetical protein